MPEKLNLEGRRSVLAGVGVIAAGLAVGATAARAQSASGQATGFRPARHDLDAWMDGLPGGHRIFVDTATAGGGAEALVYTNNLYDAQSNAYGGTFNDLAMIICFRHFSTPLGYANPLWDKYGEAFVGLMSMSGPSGGEAPKVNPVNTAGRTDLPNFGITVESLMAKGAQIAICSAATRFVAGQLAQQTNAEADDVFDELVAGAIPGARFVPAGVMALTRAQEYGYSVLIAG
jgi:hypothetical protein